MYTEYIIIIVKKRSLALPSESNGSSNKLFFALFSLFYKLALGGDKWTRREGARDFGAQRKRVE